VPMPSSRQVRKMRTAISPRFATSSFWIGATAGSYGSATLPAGCGVSS